jgi:hypothetical protein
MKFLKILKDFFHKIFLSSVPTNSAIGIEQVHPGDATFNKCNECLSFSIMKSYTITLFSISNNYDRIPGLPCLKISNNFESSILSKIVVKDLASLIIYAIQNILYLFLFFTFRFLFNFVEEGFHINTKIF